MRPARSLVVASATAAVVLFVPGTAAAHDLLMRWEVRQAEVYVEAGYSYGPNESEPAERAAVVVTNAAGETVCAGLTDERGVWTFPRPAAGTYTVVVEQAGHRATATVPVPESGTAGFTPYRLDKRVAVAVGVGLITAVTLAIRLRRKPVPPPPAS
jgi:nickel transport protein